MTTTSSTTGRHRKQTRPDHPGAALAALVWGVVGIPTLLVASTWASGVTPTELDAGTGAPSHSAVAADHAVDLAAYVEHDDPESSPDWVCWVDGNGRCSTVPLDGPGDSAAPVGAVCGSDADCAAWDLARGVVSDGRP